MNSKKILLSAFILMALAQLYVPSKMIWDKEDVLETGTEYKFKTAPIDPNDPFRGKYLTLQYAENTISVSNPDEWRTGEPIYVSLIKGKKDFAEIKSVSKTEPENTEDFIKAKVGFRMGNNSGKITIEYPFDRFYMEESKAYGAEITYRKSQTDTSKITYALVSVKNGDAVLKDILIDGISIQEIVKSK